jgi:hypothetical protein
LRPARPAPQSFEGPRLVRCAAASRRHTDNPCRVPAPARPRTFERLTRLAYVFSSRRAAHCCRLTGDLKAGQLLYRSCRGRLGCRALATSASHHKYNTNLAHSQTKCSHSYNNDRVLAVPGADANAVSRGGAITKIPIRFREVFAEFSAIDRLCPEDFFCPSHGGRAAGLTGAHGAGRGSSPPNTTTVKNPPPAPSLRGRGSHRALRFTRRCAKADSPPTPPACCVRLFAVQHVPRTPASGSD